MSSNPPFDQTRGSGKIYQAKLSYITQVHFLESKTARLDCHLGFLMLLILVNLQGFFFCWSKLCCVLLSDLGCACCSSDGLWWTVRSTLVQGCLSRVSLGFGCLFNRYCHDRVISSRLVVKVEACPSYNKARVGDV